MHRKFRAAMVVAHPDDEVLWGGGLMMSHPEWHWHVASACRGDDPERACRFRAAMEQLGSTGSMGVLDDGPEQNPLLIPEIDDTIARMLNRRRWNLVVTHGPQGEYTRHRRHEEVCESVVRLWETGRLLIGELWMFAFADDGGATLPKPDPQADLLADLDEDAWKTKHELITDTYGLPPTSWQARAAPAQEAFWIFRNPARARRFTDLRSKLVRINSTASFR